MKLLLACFLSFIGLSGVLAEEITRVFEVKYISAEHVYIGGGRNEGVNIGDTLTISRNGSEIATLQISFIADNSSSCIILTQRQPILPGDLANAIITLPEAEPEETETPYEPRKTARPVLPVESPRAKPRAFADIHGRLALQLYHYDDRNPANLDLTQPTIRLNLSAKNLGGKNIAFNLKLRSRQNYRTRAYSRNVDKSEWNNKIYEMSVSFGGNNTNYNLQLGRIIGRDISGVGYIDGLLLNKILSRSIRAGVFAGAQPRWQYAEFQTSLQKYGAFANFNFGDRRKLGWASSLAVAAEYHSSTISREYIYTQNIVDLGQRLRLYQSADIDLNRDWRKRKAGSSLALSNLYLTLRYRMSGWADINFRYDNRQNYFTYDNRNLDEQLFDTNTRQGFKGDLYLKLPGSLDMSAGMGYRKRENEAGANYSYSGGLRKSNITGLLFFMAANLNGFDGINSNGVNFSARIGKFFKRGDQFTFSYGLYRYKYSVIANSRQSQWLGFDTNIRIIKKYYLTIDYQYSFGDDLDGQRILTEIGYRF